MASLVSLAAPMSRADDVDRTIGLVIRLDQRVHIMALEFNETPGEAPDLPDRRVVDAQGLLGLGRYDEATTLLLNVIVRWPRSPAAHDAAFLLGDALFQVQDFLSARRSYEKAVSTFTGTRREQQALVRLLEIALRTGDFGHVDRYLELLARVAGSALDPAVAYATAKVLYHRDNLDEAKRTFATVAPASAYSWRARYFIGTIMVKKGDLGGAATAYEALLRTAAPDGDAEEIQDLARLALGRINYQLGRSERAAAYYQSIPPHSKVLADGLYELGWTYVKSKEFEKARSAFARLLGLRPEGPQASEVKVLMGNLLLRQGDFVRAQAAFSSARDDFEPAYRKLRAVILRSQADHVFFETLSNRSLDEVDLAAYVPDSIRRWVLADPEVTRLLTVARDVVRAQTEVADATNTLGRLQGVLADSNGCDRSALFLDLSRKRQGSTDLLSSLINIRDEFEERARRLEQPHLLEAEVQLLDQNAAERTAIERQLGARAGGDRLSVEEPMMTYARMPTIPARNSPDHVRQLRTVVLQLGGPQATPIFGIAEAQQAENPTLVSGVRARAGAERLQEIFQQEQQVQEQMLTRVGPAGRKDIDRALEVVSRAGAAAAQLFALDARIDAEADLRVAALEDVLADRRRDVAVADGELALVIHEARNVGELLTRAMYTRVADRLYDLIVRADVGLIDVAWGAKDRSSAVLQTIMTTKHLELEAVDEEQGRQQSALSQRFKAETAWEKTWVGERSLGLPR